MNPRDEILSRLEQIEREEEVRILFAVESGSRAWGFESQDSDWDVRFIYARPINWYLRPSWRYRSGECEDTITRYEGKWDLAGWDLAKALSLLAVSNPTLLEWICSPIRYRDRLATRYWLWRAAREFADPLRLQEHYLSMATQNFARHITGKAKVQVKKYFYVIRPLLALRLLSYRGIQLIDMDFSRLLRANLTEAVVLRETKALLRHKLSGIELGERDHIVLLDTWIQHEIEEHRARLNRATLARPRAAVEHCDALFRTTLKQVSEITTDEEWFGLDERVIDSIWTVVESQRRMAQSSCDLCLGEGFVGKGGEPCGCVISSSGATT